MRERPDLDDADMGRSDAMVMTGFASHYELSRLPWFAVEDGRLVLDREPDWAPFIDVHSHLALAFAHQRPMARLGRAFGMPTLDLQADTGKALHFLPMERPINLEGYQNLNFTGADVKRMRRAFVWGGEVRRSHTAPNLVRDMGDMQIGLSLLHPIDWRKPWSHNADAYVAIARDYPEIASFGSVNPKGFLGSRKKTGGKTNRRRKAMHEEAARQKAAGALGVKLHPAQQKIAPDDWRAMLLAETCAELELPIFYHAGPVGEPIDTKRERRLCQLSRYDAPIRTFPQGTFVLGHAGALQMTQALDLALRYDNVWLELSCQDLSSIRDILSHSELHDRVMFGSDWPFYHQAPMLAKVLIATRNDPTVRRKVLRDNAARLLGVEVGSRRPRVHT